MPSPFVQEVLVKSILVTLSDAVAADNFTVLHAKISKPFRDQFPPEKLRAVFKDLIDKRAVFDAIVAKPIVPDARGEDRRERRAAAEGPFRDHAEAGEIPARLHPVGRPVEAVRRHHRHRMIACTHRGMTTCVTSASPCLLSLPARPRRQRRCPPTDKAALMTGTNNSCLENQVKDPANKAMTVGQLQTYCDCYARAFSDFMQVEDLDKNKDTLTPETMKKAGEFSQACAASTLKK